MKTQEFLRLREERDRLSKAVARAQGQVDTHLMRLQEISGCTDEESARRKVKDLETELKKKEREYRTRLDEFSEKYGDKLV